LLVQPLQAKKFLILIVSIGIALIPLQASYTTYFTSNAVIPFQKPFIDTNQGLLDAGFKIIMADIWPNYPGFVKQVIDIYIVTHNLSFQELERLDHRSKYDNFLILTPIQNEKHYLVSSTRDKGMYSLTKPEADRIRILAERTPDTECHMVAEAWLEEPKFLFYTGIF